MQMRHHIRPEEKKRRNHEEDANAEPALGSRNPVPLVQVDTRRRADMNDQDAEDGDCTHRIKMSKVAISRRPWKIGCIQCVAILDHFQRMTPSTRRRQRTKIGQDPDSNP